MASRVVEKGWGKEIIFADTEHYAGKLLTFNKAAKFSMHFHREKDESWYVLEGEFELTVINTKNATEIKQTLKKGDDIRILPLVPHQLSTETGGTIIEVSMPDSVEDNYRVRPGDSQC